jgi:hypothetical protein
MPGDGTEPTGSDIDLDDAMEAVRAAGYVVVSPRKTPDERVREEILAIDFAIHRLKSAIDCGGRVGHPSLIANLTRRLEAFRPHVLTTIEAEAAE